MIDSKVCKKCLKHFPLEGFHKSKNTDGRFNVCKSCHHKRTIEWRSHNRHRTPAYSRASSYKSRYGITIHEFEKIKNLQNNLCLICKNPPNEKGPFQNQRLHVDHCHTTGKIRGLLCHLCNRGIGLFRERIDLIEKAAEYLKFHS